MFITKLEFHLRYSDPTLLNRFCCFLLLPSISFARKELLNSFKSRRWHYCKQSKMKSSRKTYLPSALKRNQSSVFLFTKNWMIGTQLISIHFLEGRNCAMNMVIPEHIARCCYGTKKCRSNWISGTLINITLQTLLKR